MIAVTSLSRLPHHLSRQTVCLDSWLSIGFDIVAVTSHADLAFLRSTYPQVGRWIVCNELATDYSRPTQRIYRLCSVADDLDAPVLVINSDIEVYGALDTITSRIADDVLVAGIRYNYPAGDVQRSRREQWGIDAFLITPAMARTLPPLGFAIGRPVWDYWLPLHFRGLGFAMDFIGDPLFYHESHPVLWSQADWRMGAAWIESHYNYPLPNWAREFRHSLPYPPNEMSTEFRRVGLCDACIPAEACAWERNGSSMPCCCPMLRRIHV